jgi:hypothetical protein
LGALLITQQPGSIPVDILSQGDNWFIFHLLSAADLTNVRRANAHFSEDLLSVLLNEPIPGQGVFWSSVGTSPYPISMRVFSFEGMYPLRDPGYEAPAAETFAAALQREYADMFAEPAKSQARDGNGRAQDQGQAQTVVSLDLFDNDRSVDDQPDILVLFEEKAVERLQRNIATMKRLQADGVPWGALNSILETALPDAIDNRHEVAYRLVPKVLTHIYGERGHGWDAWKNDRGTTMVRALPK